MFSIHYLKHVLYEIFFPTKHLSMTYQAFRKLLEYDHQSHEMLALLEKLYHEKKGVEFYAAVEVYKKLSHGVSKMAELLDAMVPRSYRKLRLVFRNIDSAIRASALKMEEPAPSSPSVLALDRAAVGAESLAGSKAKRLGRIGSELLLPVPRGFVITTRAFHHFCEVNRLKSEVERVLGALDVDSPHSLETTSERLTSLLLDAPIPSDLGRTLRDTWESISSARSARWAVRSSAVGEDAELSFAGQFRTLLNVDSSQIDQAYKEVIASKYSPNALLYRIKNGLLDQETPMAVLVLEMINPEASGIVYSRSPVSSGSLTTTVYAVWGLGEHLVSGATSPDVIEVSRENGKAAGVVRKSQGARESKMVISVDGRVRTVALEPHEKQRLSLDEEGARQLAAWACQLESLFGTPQDVEWCRDRQGRLYVLQSRPLHLEQEAQASCEMDLANIPNPVLLSGGERAASGIGSGTVVVADSPADLRNIPKGSVLVSRITSPRWAQSIDRLSAVVADLGSVAGHFASVAREWGVPTLVNTTVATQKLKSGDTVTVDADRATVFAGTVKGLSASSCDQKGLSPERPFMKRLRHILDHASPLNLLNPQDPGFIPENCRTLHDMIRFVHEKAVQEMFTLGGRSRGRVRGAKKLISEIPITLYVLDLGNGASNHPVRQKEIHLKEVENTGLQALWKGLSHPEIEWSSDILHFDWEEFDRLSAGIISMDSQLLASFAVISQDYLNINVRFGYHFVVIDALFGESPKENYLSLRFRGGGALPEGRSLRVQFLARVLQYHGFESGFEGDTIDARHRGGTQSEVERKLGMLGFLLGFTRLMDQKLQDMKAVGTYVEEFLRKAPRG